MTPIMMKAVARRHILKIKAYLLEGMSRVQLRGSYLKIKWQPVMISALNRKRLKRKEELSTKESGVLKERAEKKGN